MTWTQTMFPKGPQFTFIYAIDKHHGNQRVIPTFFTNIHLNKESTNDEMNFNWHHEDAACLS